MQKSSCTKIIPQLLLDSDISSVCTFLCSVLLPSSRHPAKRALRHPYHSRTIHHRQRAQTHRQPILRHLLHLCEWNEKYYTLTNQIVFDENHPLLYFHPTDQIFTVYSAPTSTAYIEANGKAKVSTNDWILIYGEENNYYFIQYSIDAETMRYGYIQSDSLTCPDTGEIIWLNQEGSTKKKVTLINDPCGNKTKIKILPRGTEIKILGTLNGWAYIECYTSLVVRGFVEYKILNTK